MARDGKRDVVRCGMGNDVARVDAKDKVRRCERTRSPARGSVGGSGTIPDTGAVAKQDLAAGSNVAALWDHVNPNLPRQVKRRASGGDPHPLVDGSVNKSYRRIVIHDGGQATHDSSQERLQLGANSTSNAHTFKAYHQGERWITYWSMRIQPLAIASGEDEQLWEMYQQGGPGGSPSLQFRREPNNAYSLLIKPSSSHSSVKLWHGQVPVDTWLRFAIDVRYSTNPNDSKVQLWGDMGGNPTDLSLKKLTPMITGYSTIMPGASADALIAGIYQDSRISGHHIDVANWQVARWGP